MSLPRTAVIQASYHLTLVAVSISLHPWTTEVPTTGGAERVFQLELLRLLVV